MYNQYKFTQAAIERSVEIVIYVLFQFTRPHGPRFFAVLPKTVIISIHATLQAAMRISLQSQRSHVDFNSRDPYGPRLLRHSVLKQRNQFQFTRPIRAAIADYMHAWCVYQISIHATHTGRDRNIQQIIAINLLRFSYIPYKKAWIRS